MRGPDELPQSIKEKYGKVKKTRHIADHTKPVVIMQEESKAPEPTTDKKKKDWTEIYGSATKHIGSLIERSNQRLADQEANKDTKKKKKFDKPGKPQNQPKKPENNGPKGEEKPKKNKNPKYYLGSGMGI